MCSQADNDVTELMVAVLCEVMPGNVQLAEAWLISIQDNLEDVCVNKIDLCVWAIIYRDVLPVRKRLQEVLLMLLRSSARTIQSSHALNNLNLADTRFPFDKLVDISKYLVRDGGGCCDDHWARLVDGWWKICEWILIEGYGALPRSPFLLERVGDCVCALYDAMSALKNTQCLQIRNKSVIKSFLELCSDCADENGGMTEDISVIPPLGHSFIAAQSYEKHQGTVMLASNGSELWTSQADMVEQRCDRALYMLHRLAARAHTVAEESYGSHPDRVEETVGGMISAFVWAKLTANVPVRLDIVSRLVAVMVLGTCRGSNTAPSAIQGGKLLEDKIMMQIGKLCSFVEFSCNCAAQAHLPQQLATLLLGNDVTNLNKISQSRTTAYNQPQQMDIVYIQIAGHLLLRPFRQLGSNAVACLCDQLLRLLPKLSVHTLDYLCALVSALLRRTHRQRSVLAGYDDEASDGIETVQCTGDEPSVGTAVHFRTVGHQSPFSGDVVASVWALANGLLNHIQFNFDFVRLRLPSCKSRDLDESRNQRPSSLGETDEFDESTMSCSSTWQISRMCEQFKAQIDQLGAICVSLYRSEKCDMAADGQHQSDRTTRGPPLKKVESINMTAASHMARFTDSVRCTAVSLYQASNFLNTLATVNVFAKVKYLDIKYDVASQWDYDFIDEDEFLVSITKSHGQPSRQALRHQGTSTTLRCSTGADVCHSSRMRSRMPDPGESLLLWRSSAMESTLSVTYVLEGGNIPDIINLLK
jgi:hypothetical protein